MKEFKGLVLLLISSLLFYSCEQVNYKKEDGKGQGGDYGVGVVLTDVNEATMEGQLQSAMEYLIDTREHKYQYQRNLNVDVFSGYLALCHNFDGRQSTTYYYPNNPFIRGVYGEVPKIFPLLAPAMKFGAKHHRSDLAAIANIMYCYSMHEVADAFGPVAYHDWKVLKEYHPLHYISADSTYSVILRELSAAVDTLKKYQPSVVQLQKVEGKERGTPCKWQWQNWVKFANSLQLRLAMNMVNKYPERSKLIAERVVNDEIGVLEYEDEDIGFDSNLRYMVHPLYKISCIWVDTRLNASFENVLKRYRHPLLETYFKKNGTGLKPGNLYDKITNNQTLAAGSTCLGIRQGIMLRPQSNDKDYLTFSEFTSDMQYLPFTWLKTAEVLFLRAEGALRGWNMGGSAKEFYEYGIRKGLADIGKVADYPSYVVRNADTSIDYTDYYDSENNIQGRVTVPVKWDAANSSEVKLEQIITQKWIANFPMSMEAWTTFRRTGYPRLFPVKMSLWNGGAPDNEIQIRRIPWDESPKTSDEINTYNNFLLPACERGLNEASNPLFWDISGTWTKGPDGQVIPNNNLP